MALSFFLLLLLGHLIGDFLLQPFWLVMAKRRGWIGLTIHVGVVTFVTTILIWMSTLPNRWTWMGVLFLGHLFIDQFRTFHFVDTSKGKGLWFLLLDQLAHLMLIGILAWAAAGWHISDLAILTTPQATNEQRLLAYLVGFVVLIGFAPILEVETAVTALYFGGQDTDETVMVLKSDRVYGGMERVAGAAIVWFGFWFFSPLVFLPRLWYMMGQSKIDGNDGNLPVITKALVSFFCALVVGYLLTLIPPPSFLP